MKNIKKNNNFRFEYTTLFRLVWLILLALALTVAAGAQNKKQKKWTYDFSEVVKYFDTPLEACRSYAKEKYPNEKYEASIEATNDPETYRCSAGDTYFGLVYKTECKNCESEMSALSQVQVQFGLTSRFSEVRLNSTPKFYK